MSAELISKPIGKFKKIRSLDEFLTRGGQAISAYREQRRGGGSVPTDEEFAQFIDREVFGTAPVIAESLWQRFFKNGQERFFPAFRHPQETPAAFRQFYGDAVADRFVADAERIIAGRVDLMGLSNLYVGTDIDWHREPVSAKQSPLKHWKQFDDLDSAETGNKKIVWELNRHQFFFTLGVAYWMTGEERFAKTFVRHLSSWIEQNPPGLGVNWSSSLEVAFRAMSWIWAFHFFRDSDHFKPELFRTAIKYLYLHGRHIELYLSKYYSPNTHLTGEALGLYYLGTQMPFLGRSVYWRELGERILFAEIEKQVLPDGVYFEQSTWYQRYTLDIYTHFILLRAQFGEPYFSGETVKLETRLQQACDFLTSVTLPDGRTPLIGDDDGGRLLPLTTAGPDDLRGSLAPAAVIFDRSDYKFAAGRSTQELFWLMGPDTIVTYNAIEKREPIAGSAAFPDGGYCVMRDGRDDTHNYMLVDCGGVGALSGGHGHADTLSIVASVYGQALFVDSGTYTYHESRELRDYFRSTAAHNTLEVDGASSSEPGNAFNWKTRAEAERRSWISDLRFDFFEGSHNGYQRLPGGGKHTRSILFLKGDYWIMRDLFETAGEHEYSLNFHYDVDRKPRIGGDGSWVGDDGHRMFTFGDNGRWDRKESWISNNHGNRTNAPFLRYLSKGLGTQEFFTFIVPCDRHIQPPEVSEIPAPSGRAFVIKYAGYTDVFVFNDEPGNGIATGLFDTDFRYTWARLAEGETTPDEFVLIDGRTFSVNGREVFGVPATRHASARRLGDELFVRNDIGLSKVSLRPKR
jgi:hypothetical protein